MRTTFWEARHDGRIGCDVTMAIGVSWVEGLNLTNGRVLAGMYACWSWACGCGLALGYTDGVSDSVLAKAVWLSYLKIRDGRLLWDGKRSLHNLGDGLRGVCEEGKGCEPDVVAFWRGGREFEGPSRSQDQDGSVEEWGRAFGSRIVIFYIQDGLDGHYQS
jgi:hypothetical protein